VSAAFLHYIKADNAGHKAPWLVHVRACRCRQELDRESVGTGFVQATSSMNHEEPLPTRRL
jgi:hypothetical protein